MISRKLWTAEGVERRERGETTTQIVLLVPIVVTILMIAVQSAIYFHTSAVAGAAASHGASAAAVQGETIDAVAHLGREAAQDILMDAGVSRSRVPDVIVSAETVSVGVEVEVPRIVPYFPHTVRRVATEPRERFITESMR
ncbi:MAG: TadE/TadG family type IV pilus assembly protein [Actinomycetota bacterium]